MTFRDDREANRARIEALEEDLAEARAETEAAKREAAEAKEEARRARSGIGGRRARSAPGEPSDKSIALFIAVVFGLPALMTGYWIWSERRSYGWPIPKEPTTEQRLPGCSCRLADGRTVELSVRVDDAGAIQSPGEPWKMDLSWYAHGAGDPLPLRDPLSTETTGVPRQAQEQLMFGYVIDVGVACVGDDRLVVASQGRASTWSLSSRRFLQRQQFDPPKSQMLSGRRMELRCRPLETRGNTVLVPAKKGDFELKVSTTSTP